MSYMAKAKHVNDGWQEYGPFFMQSTAEEVVAQLASRSDIRDARVVTTTDMPSLEQLRDAFYNPADPQADTSLDAALQRVAEVARG